VGDHQRWQATVASDGGRESTIIANTTAAATTTVARFKRSDIQTHCFSTLDGICWALF